MKPTNVRNLASLGQQQLTAANITSARLDALILLGHVIDKDKAWILSHPEHEISSPQLSEFKQLIEQRTQNVPIAYLIKHRDFYGRNFYVTPDVLVPRPETEQLIEHILQLDGVADKPLRVLDIGTGSGALAITLALERPNWKITATDISLTALEVAKTNAKLLTADTVQFSRQDLLTNDNHRYDIIVSNLPYVPTSLHAKADLAHEPPLALFAGNDGLEAYKELFRQLSTRKYPVPQVVTESLEIQHGALADIALTYNYRLVATRQLIQQFSYIY